MKQVELGATEYLKVLLYGDSGVGKTTLVGSAMECEQSCPILVLNSRGQPVSLRHFDPPPLVIEIEAMSDYNTPYGWIQAGQGIDVLREASEQEPGLKDWYRIISTYFDKTGFDHFKSIAMDSVTQTARIALKFIVGDNTKTLLPGNLLQAAQIQHWGQLLRQLTNWSDLYFKLQIHVFATTLTQRRTIESLGRTLFSPAISGQSGLEVPSHAELVGRLICCNILSAQQMKTLEAQAAKEGYKELPFNALLTLGGRNFMAKWQGVPSNANPGILLAPTVQKLIDIAGLSGAGPTSKQASK